MVKRFGDYQSNLQLKSGAADTLGGININLINPKPAICKYM